MLWEIIISFTLILVGVNADYTFTFELQSFSSSSPLERIADLACCVCCEDPISNTCPSLCNTTILICVRDADHDENDNSCPRGALVVPADSSPMEFSDTFAGPWMNEIQISITIFHHDQSDLASADIGTVASQTLIDLFIVNELVLSPSDPPTPTTNFPGLFGNVAFSSTFHVECAPNFFGPDCSMMCESRDDDLGHFTCDGVTGLRVCLEGYVDVERNCTECKPSAGCSLIGGFCDEPGECICFDGFSGDNCSESINGSTASFLSPSRFISATATIQIASSALNNVITSTAGLPLVSTQSTMLQSSFTSLASVMRSSVLDLPSQTPTPTSVTLAQPTGEFMASTQPSMTPSNFAAVSFAPETEVDSRPSGVQNTRIITPTNDVGLNSVDGESDRLIYIIVGATVGAVVLVLISLLGFMTVMMVVTRKYRKRKALQQKNESRYTDVISNVGTSSRFASNTTLNKTDPYLDTPAQDSDAMTTLPHPTYSTFQHEDSGILTQETNDSEEAMYATPIRQSIVLTNNSAHTPDPTKKDHEYAVLECTDLTEGGASKPEQSIMNDTDLLDSIERTMLQINKELQDEYNNMVSAESDLSFIYSDHDSDERSDNDSGLHNTSLSPVSISN